MTMKVLESLNALHKIDLDSSQFQIVMSVISEVTKLAYEEGVEHGKNEGYGEGYEAGKNCIVAEHGNYDSGWNDGFNHAREKYNEWSEIKPMENSKLDDIPF